MTPKALLNIPYRRWSKACKKWSYPSKDMALRYLAETRARRLREGCTGKIERGVYPCGCGWHVTSKGGKG